MENAGTDGEEQDDGAVDYVALREGHVVHCIRDGIHLRDAQGCQHGTVPEAAAAHVGREAKDDAEGQNAFNGTGDDAQREHLGVVLVPRLDVKGHGC